MWNRRSALAMLAVGSGLLLVACNGGGDGSPSAGSAPSPGSTPEATPRDTGTAVSSGGSLITPPLEGPPRVVPAQETTNYWELSEFQLPEPQDLPEPPEDADGPEFSPPANAECPADWQELRRPGEGFSICYPEDWRMDGHGYVSAGVEERWYSAGLFLFDGDAQKAHVSVYVVGPFARPFTYTRDCEQPYKVTFAGHPAVLCPDFPGVRPEARIIAYHVRWNDLDYYVNVVPYFEFDEEAGAYLDTVSEEAEAMAIEIAHTFRFIDLQTP